MSQPVKIMAILTARSEKADELKALVFDTAPLSRAEPGNLRWDIWQDQIDPGRFVLDELYVDNAAVAAHRETPHFRNYLANINNLAERIALVLDPADIT